LIEEGEHGGAEVYSVGVEGGILREEAGGETAVTVAEDEGVGARCELREEVKAAALEGAAEGEVLEPAVGASDAVEVGWGCQWSSQFLSSEEEEERSEETEVGGGAEGGGGEAESGSMKQEKEGGGEGAADRDGPGELVVGQSEGEAADDGCDGENGEEA
jgi:hypothetical protein